MIRTADQSIEGIDALLFFLPVTVGITDALLPQVQLTLLLFNGQFEGYICSAVLNKQQTC